MKIAQKDLLGLAPASNEYLHFWTSASIVGRIYCGPMTVAGLCTGDCQDCQAVLSDAFCLKQANNPAALLTYNLRLAVAKKKEAIQKAPKPVEKDAFQRPVEVNPFAVLAGRR